MAAARTQPPPDTPLGGAANPNPPFPGEGQIDHFRDDKPTALLAAAPRVINVGLELFALDLAAHGAAVQHVQWAPPAHANAHLLAVLAKLGC